MLNDGDPYSLKGGLCNEEEGLFGDGGGSFSEGEHLFTEAKAR